MDRPVIYSTEQGRSADFLFGMRAAMIGVAKLSEAILGTSTVVSGLPVTPTSPAGLTVNVGPGQIYSLASVDATAYGALAADTTDQVVKQGLLMATQNLSCPAPGTTGYSINYLIQATYQDQDLNNVVLPYYNSANPSQPLSGQNNTGAAQPTERHGVCVVAVKAGAAATTGTQTTPAPDAGYVGLWVVTVANGQSTITSSSISAYSGSPLLPTSGALHWNIQTVTATGTLGAFVTNTLTRINSASATTQTLPPANTVPAGTVAEFFNINTGTGTVARNGSDTIQLNASTGTSVALGAGDSLRLLCDGVSSWQAFGGAAQIGAASAGQALCAPIGTATAVKMAVATASASATITADEIVVGTALGGQNYRLASFSQTINLATTGAGGMDTGTAPVSGYVALYVIYNPITKTSALLATNATSAAAASVYGGANMPVGYSASGLVSVWPTDGAGKLKTGLQSGKTVAIANTSVLSTSTLFGAWTSLSLSSVVPANAKSVTGTLNVSNTATGSEQTSIFIAGDSVGSGSYGISCVSTSSTGAGVTSTFPALNLGTAQTLYYETAATTGTGTFQINISSYTI